MLEANVLIDLAILAVLIIGSVAFMGTITNEIGMKILGGKNVYRYRNKTLEITKGWKQVGGKK